MLTNETANGTTSKVDQKADELKEMLGEIEMGVLAAPLTLADLIREGTRVTGETTGWGNGLNACALGAAVISAKARDILK